MSQRTSVSKYRDHRYSGPKKSRKRSRAQLERYHGEGVSREDVWRQRSDKENEPGHSLRQNISKNYNTYERPPRKFRLEATETDTNPTPMASTSKDEPLSINWPLDPTLESHQLCIEKVPYDNLSGLSGCRMVDIQHVLYWAFALERHRMHCQSSAIEFINETRHGFNSIFTFKCANCNKEFQKSNEKEPKLNTAFVWGTVTAGSYYTQAAHLTNLMDIPTMSASYFRKIEMSLGEVWEDHLTEEIKRVGEQEKVIAIEKGHVNSDGIPYIEVYVDGGWAKRSYGHDYNSSSGMACIIGKETKQCLYLGIKNKYCYHCHIYERKDETVPPHNCFRNYQGPSTGMEAAILVEGFQQSEEMHGLQYLSFIGDGDSSVYAQLQEKVLYGKHIKKIECKNHVIKNYTSKLYKILANTKLPLHGRKLLKAKLSKLTVVSRKIIMHNSKDRNAMRVDLKNGPLHVFGKHTNCKSYYCKWKADASEKPDEDLVEDIIKNAATVWALICAANEGVMAKSNRLSNETTNIVENFMSIISKYNCGKRLNLHKGGSYHHRVQIAGISQISGQKWHGNAMRAGMKTSPGKNVKKYIEQQEKSRARHKACKRKRLFFKTSKSKSKPDTHYGPDVADGIDTVDEQELKQACEEKLQDFQKTPEEIRDIELSSIGQHENDLYNTHRSDRLTASHFGVVCKRRKNTPCHNHVKQILYKNNIMTNDMMYGQQHESVARTLFIEHYKKAVRQAGLFIDEEYGFLGASPDGVLTNENAILEIKCFPSLARNIQDIESAAKERKNFPIILQDGGFKMNKKHSYYYQVQGQLRITKMAKCYFVCFITPLQPITVVEVDRDENFIQEMVPKLVSFYKECILPEIILRRVRKNAKCYDPTNK